MKRYEALADGTKPKDLPDEAFSIRWDESMGCFRVSRPGLWSKREWVVPADAYRGAVDLLDDMSDVLAEVTRGQLRPDSEAVRDVLRRATAHVNGQRSPVVTTKATT